METNDKIIEAAAEELAARAALEGITPEQAATAWIEEAQARSAYPEVTPRTAQGQYSRYNVDPHEPAIQRRAALLIEHYKAGHEENPK